MSVQIEATTGYKLIVELEKKVLEIHNKGTQVAVTQLLPARGAWRHVKRDVMAFQGWIEICTLEAKPTLHSFGSWSSMTLCLRRGFTVKDCRGLTQCEVDFEIDLLPV